MDLNALGKLARITGAASLALALAVPASGCAASPSGPDAAAKASEASGAQTEASDEGGDDLVIQIGDLSSTAKFYPVTVEGVNLEVLAVEAPDGSVRTAFNTCQVCYDSGRGYYKQEGDALVCQNCGNRFKMSQVEIVSGGCNPVPIFDENKTETAETVTISYEFLKEAKGIFSQWKTEY